MPRKHTGFFLLAMALLAVVAYLSLARNASAECGSSASSCKDCHEVKKQSPVNSKGAWHTGHAFGDFCEFCHSGNVKGKDKTAAHTGLTSPLADVKASCQSCHPNDFLDRAQKYATALGKPLGSGASGAMIPAATGTTTTTTTGPCGPAGPTGGQTIDLNKVYADAKSAPPANSGNMILLALIAAISLLLIGLIWYYEKPAERISSAFRHLLATPVLAPAMAGAGIGIPANIVRRPEMGPLLQLLNESDPVTVRALAHLLADRENGAKVIKAVSNLDYRTLAALGEGDQKALAALLALAKEMNA